MNTADIKLELFRKLDQLSSRELNTVRGLFTNYLNAQDDINEWESLIRDQKRKIEAGLQQADIGLTKPVNTVTKRLKKKYAIHG